MFQPNNQTNNKLQVLEQNISSLEKENKNKQAVNKKLRDELINLGYFTAKESIQETLKNAMADKFAPTKNIEHKKRDNTDRYIALKFDPYDVKHLVKLDNEIDKLQEI